MEENNDDIIYDLDRQEAEAERAEEPSAQESHAGSAGSADSTDSADSGGEEGTQENTDSSGLSGSERELRRMVEEMGADTVLEIIRNNRNAAIRQIISEVEASRDVSIPSGDSASVACRSIFDLAALA